MGKLGVWLRQISKKSTQPWWIWGIAIAMLLLCLCNTLFKEFGEHWHLQRMIFIGNMVLGIVSFARYQPHASKSENSPWWLWGCIFVFVGFLFLHIVLNMKAPSDYVIALFLMGALLLGLLVRFVLEIFRQHAQFSIRSVLYLTIFVALIGSVYRCFGMELVAWVLSAMMLLTIWFADQMRAQRE